MPNEREMNKLADKFRQSSVEVIINAEGERRWYTLTEQESKHLADISINYRAELTAPAEGDVEAAEKAYKRAMIKASIKRKRGSLFLSSEIHKALVSEIAAALTATRKAAEARVKALEAVARSAEIDLGIAIDILEKHNYVHAKELQETRDKLAALLAGEGRGEE